MTRVCLPYQVDDLSTLARSLERQIATTTTPPGHVEMMNMLARGAGFRNFQHFRASAVAGEKMAAPVAQADMTKVAQARRFFDADGRMVSWPAKTHLQKLCLWVIWARLPRGAVMTEREISAELNRWHLFGDAAILRRTMWEMKLVRRSVDSRDYERLEQMPPPEAVALIRAITKGS